MARDCYRANGRDRIFKIGAIMAAGPGRLAMCPEMKIVNGYPCRIATSLWTGRQALFEVVAELRQAFRIGAVIGFSVTALSVLAMPVRDTSPSSRDGIPTEMGVPDPAAGEEWNARPFERFARAGLAARAQ